MRILVLSDVHSNLPALDAVLRDAGSWDAAYYLGDVVGRGPYASECFEAVKRLGASMIRGNHDHFIAMDQYEGIGESLATVNRINRGLLTGNQIAEIAARPLTLCSEAAGRRLFCVHSTPMDPLGEYVYEDGVRLSGGGLLAGVKSDILLMGHTHVPYVVACGDGLIVNPGSVGLPRDEPRASYAVLDIGEKVEAKIHRVAYNEEEVIGEMKRKGFPEAFVANIVARFKARQA